VGIGTSSPDQTLHVHKGSAGTIASQANSVLTLENSTTAVLQFLTPNTAAGQIRFGDPQDNGAGFIQYDHSDSSLQFGTNGPEKMRIDSAGNVGIGTSGPEKLLTLEDAHPTIAFNHTTSWPAANQELGIIEFRTEWNGVGAKIQGVSDAQWGNTDYPGRLTFHTTSDGSASPVERMRIDSSGNLSVGHTTTGGSKFAICDGANSQIQFFPEFSTDSNLTQHYDPTAAAYMGAETRASSFTWRLGTARAMAIDSSGTVMDYITSSGGNADLRYHTGTSVVSYDTSSERFKTNIRDNTTYGLAAVNALQSRMFEYKDDGRTDVGLIAEEVAEVVPELVGLDDENNPLTVDYKRFVSVLIKAIQELTARVAELEGE
jgi:hypothetical protein